MKQLVRTPSGVLAATSALIRGGMLRAEEEWRKEEGHIEGDAWVDEVEGGELEHQFMSGMYVRRVLLPAGMFLTTKIHKVRHPFFMMKGRCKVLSAEKGVEELVGPVMGVTEAGTKRMMHILEDVEWYTVHAVEGETPEEAEEEVIAKDFSGLGFSEHEINRLMESS